MWLHEPPTHVRLIAEDEAATATRFSLWAVPTHKHLFHDGHRLHLTCSEGVSEWRVSLPAELPDRASVAFVVRHENLAAQSRAISGFTLMLDLRNSGFPESRPLRAPSRPPTDHLYALQALDGVAAGATQREIAAVLFGAATVASRWYADSDLRARFRYVLCRARALSSGGYRLLVGPPDRKRAGRGGRKSAHLKSSLPGTR